MGANGGFTSTEFGGARLRGRNFRGQKTATKNKFEPSQTSKKSNRVKKSNESAKIQKFQQLKLDAGIFRKDKYKGKIKFDKF